MYLEKLELIGFKSFADKTEFNFESGMTIVVGPNGCGKSNVVDAIKWVLGEQSVKSLRGSEMADVIFNGTTSRKPLGYAEVSLIFSNTKNILPIDYDQVRVTRRLYRTGESEYFLNKAKCRLRDIKELFMGTGVGTNCYSVIEQGRIDVLLQANPQERRGIFEEAAGISKYKAKKKTALNKLDRVEQNLLRLSDIIAEVEKQMRSLHRQAGKARRYREYSHQLKSLKTAYSLYQYDLQHNSYIQLSQAVAEAEAHHGQKQAEIEKMEAESSRLSTEAVDIEQLLREKEGARIEIDNLIRSREADIRRSQDRIQETEQAEARSRQEILTIRARLSELKLELLHTVNEIESTESDIGQLSESLEQGQQKQRELSDAAAALGRQMQGQRAAMMELYNERSRYENEKTALERDRKAIEEQIRRTRARREQIEKDLTDLEFVRVDAEAAIEKLTGELESAEAELSQTVQQIDQLEESLVQLDSHLAETRHELSSKESRQRVLQDLERKREGMGTGVKQVLNAVQQQQLRGIIGTVAELIEVDVEYALAIEASLSSSAQMIITDATADSRAAIEFLRDDDLGRATFLPMDRLRPCGNGRPAIRDNGAYLGPASLFARISGDREDILGHLLSGTHLVKDFESALELAPLFPPSARLVTLEGDVVSCSGPITGGGKVDRLGLISRRSELRQLEKQVAELQARMTELVGQRDSAHQQLQSLRRCREELQEKTTHLNIQLSEQRSLLEQTRREIEDARQEDALLASEITAYDAQTRDINDQLQELNRKVTETEEREQKIRTELSELEEAQKDTDARREALRETLSRLQANLAGLREKLHALRNSRQGCSRMLQEQKDALLYRFREIDQSQVRNQAARADIQAAEDSLQGLFADLQQRQEELRAESNRREELRASADKLTSELRQASHDLRDLDDDLRGLQLKESQAEIRRENLAEKARTELDINLPQLIEQNVQPQLEEDMESWDAVKEQIDVIESRIRNLGNVYEDAIEEYEQLELRSQMLTTQEQDLVEAKRKLQEIVRKINRTSRRLFETTFNTVRENFRDLFSKLFGGGRAEIFLEEGVDILEAGIEIVARPPGKSENTVLSLMSGGEKALTTVALLFAIFRSRPSPFCILDEVDAPLDESNIDRFIDLVQEFNLHTQFLMITHNRRTMRSGNVIYGVTMQEPGVSRKVAVRFEDLEAQPTRA